MNNQHKKPAVNAGPTANNDEQQAESSYLPFDLLTINDRKSSLYDSQFISQDRQVDCCFPSLGKPHSLACKKTKNVEKQGRFIVKRQKQGNDERKVSVNRKRKITLLENKIQQLQRQIAALRRNQHFCVNCNEKLPGFYRQKITEIILPEQPARSVAGDFDSRRISKDSLEFERVDFHSPLMQTQEMEEKMWIFLGTMLIAMGSKIMDFDGTLNTFRILKQSVDQMRRQVEKGQKNVGIDFFCCKQDLNEPSHVIDGVNFDPFYNSKQEFVQSHFTLEGVKLQSVQEYELFYDYKYHYCIQYDALLTIMEYARDHCTLS